MGLSSMFATFDLATMDWPAPSEIQQRSDYLLYGITAKALDAFLLTFGFPHRYERDEAELSWVTELHGHPVTGYDLVYAIRLLFRRKGYERFSVVEVLLAAGWSGVRRANRYLIHPHAEPIEQTMQDMATACGEGHCCGPADLCFFVDYLCLRQCDNQLPLGELREAIQQVGHSVMRLNPLPGRNTPETSRRLWCMFETYTTVELGAQLSAILGLGGYLSLDHNAVLRQLDLTKASSHSLLDRDQLMVFFEAGPGLLTAHRVLRDALRKSCIRPEARYLSLLWVASLGVFYLAVAFVMPTRDLPVAMAMRPVRGLLFLAISILHALTEVRTRESGPMLGILNIIGRLALTVKPLWQNALNWFMLLGLCTVSHMTSFPMSFVETVGSSLGLALTASLLYIFYPAAVLTRCSRALWRKCSEPPPDSEVVLGPLVLQRRDIFLFAFVGLPLLVVFAISPEFLLGCVCLSMAMTVVLMALRCYLIVERGNAELSMQMT